MNKMSRNKTKWPLGDNRKGGKPLFYTFNCFSHNTSGISTKKGVLYYMYCSHNCTILDTDSPVFFGKLYYLYVKKVIDFCLFITGPAPHPALDVMCPQKNSSEFQARNFNNRDRN